MTDRWDEAARNLRKLCIEGPSDLSDDAFLPTETALSGALRLIYAEGFKAGQVDMRKRAAKEAKGWPHKGAAEDYRTCGDGSFWDAGTPYDQGRTDSADRIRSLPIKES